LAADPDDGYEPSMRAGLAAMVAVVTLLLVASAWAFIPFTCRQRLVGEFRPGGGPPMSVALNLHIVSYDGLNVRGRMRCTTKNDPEEECFLPRVLVDGVFDFDESGANSLGRKARLTLTGDDGVRCTLEARTPYARKLCLGAVGGTFECTDSLRGSVSGAFGFSVDRCGPCLVGY